MRPSQVFASVVAIALIAVSCKTDGNSGRAADGTKAGPTIEQKLEKWLDRVDPKQTEFQAFQERNKGVPEIIRNSDAWNLKVTPGEFEQKWLGAKMHRVSVFGQVRSTGIEKQEVGKFIVIAMTQDSKEFKDIVRANATFSLKEIDQFVKAVDLAIKVKSQVSLGSSDVVLFHWDLVDGSRIAGRQGHKWKPNDEKGEAEQEMEVGLGIDKASFNLKPGDWMELKLKIEAARKWLETQNGDEALLAPEKPKEGAKK